ncbi:MAG: TonB-dependent receptor [Pseudomonadota bacterium]
MPAHRIAVANFAVTFGRFLVLTLVILASGAQAQEPTRVLNIPKQSLADSLSAISNTFSIAVEASPALLQGKEARALQGEFRAQAALERVLAGSGLVLQLSGAGSFAVRQASSRRSAQLEEVFVYGVKEPLTLQQITTSADVFSEDRLQRENLFQLGDVLQRTPNVTGGLSNITIRGIPRGFVAGAGLAPSRGDTVTITVDGAPVSSIALEGNSFVSMWDVRQTEVLRGPQSSLQGRNALAGAVVISTNSPSYEWEAKVRALGAENDTQQYAGMVSGPLIADQLAFRITADYQSTDGYVDNAITGDNIDQDESLLARGKLLIEPDVLAGFRAELIYEYTDADLGGGSAVFGPGAVNHPAFSNFVWRDLESYDRPTSTDTDTRRSIANLSYEINPSMMLRLLGSYEDSDSANLIGNIDDPTIWDFNRVTDGSSQTYTGELQFIYELANWSGLVGVYYYNDSDTVDGRSAASLASSSPLPVEPADSQLRFSQVIEGETENYAAFINTRYDVDEKWTISAGLRYDVESVDLRSFPVADVEVLPRDCVIIFPGDLRLDCLEQVLQFNPPSEDPQQELDFDAWLPRGAITYHVTQELSVFVSAARGYRAGGTYLQNVIDGTVGGVVVREFDPEYLDDYELGFRFLGLDNRLRFNGNLFYSLYKDQQVRVNGPSGTTFDEEILNAARSRSYGLELETSYYLNEALGLYASIGLLNAEFEDFPWGDEGTARENLKGSTLPGAAKFSGNIGLTYADKDGFLADISLYYQSPVESDIANLDGRDFGVGLTERTGSLTLVNARLGYEGKNWLFALFATNLFDDETPQSINIGASLRDEDAVSYFDNPRYNVTQPRTVGMMLELSL